MFIPLFFVQLYTCFLAYYYYYYYYITYNYLIYLTTHIELCLNVYLNL